MYEFFYSRMDIGDSKSPLDFIFKTIDAHSAWDVVKTTYIPTPISGQNRLEELWVQTNNTSTGEVISLQFYAPYGLPLEVAYSRGTSLSDAWDSQPETPKDSISREGTKINEVFITDWGLTLAPVYTSIVISRDLIHVVFQGTVDEEISLKRATLLYTVIDKAHNFSDGVLFVTSHKSGKGYIGIHYNGYWYQEGFGNSNSISGLQGRINALANAHMFEKNYNTYGSYVAPVSIHCNTTTDGSDLSLELVGFLPSVYGKMTHQFPNLLSKESVKGIKHIALPIENIPLIDTLLYPIE